MKLNCSAPSFGCHMRIDVKQEPTQLINMMEIAFNKNVVIEDTFRSEKDKDTLSYKIHVPKHMSESLQEHLTQNGMSFEVLA